MQGKVIAKLEARLKGERRGRFDNETASEGSNHDTTRAPPGGPEV